MRHLEYKVPHNWSLVRDTETGVVSTHTQYMTGTLSPLASRDLVNEIGEDEAKKMVAKAVSLQSSYVAPYRDGKNEWEQNKKEYDNIPEDEKPRAEWKEDD